MVYFSVNHNADASQLFDDLQGLTYHLRAYIEMRDEPDLVGGDDMADNTFFLQLLSDLASAAPLLYFEDNDIGLYRHDTRDETFFLQRLRQLAGMIVVDGKPADIILEGIDTRGGHETGLTHTPAEDLPDSPRLFDEGRGSDQDAADGTTHAFIQTHRDRIENPTELSRSLAFGVEGIE